MCAQASETITGGHAAREFARFCFAAKLHVPAATFLLRGSAFSAGFVSQSTQRLLWRQKVSGFS
jgi:hypothetical protein